MEKHITRHIFIGILAWFIALPVGLRAQKPVDRDMIIAAAREIIKETTYCALITLDAEGQPQVRTMNPFPANDEFVTWFATARKSRKVMEIKNNPRVSVYYADHVNAKGYVAITGTAEVIDDKALLLKMKRDYWEGIKGWQDHFVLIRIVPKSMDVINYKRHVTNDPETLRAPSISF